MTLSEQIYAQALLLCGSLDERQDALLKLLCQAAMSGLTLRLRSGMTPSDCRADFVGAASLYALAALSEADGMEGIESFTAGDVTVRRTGGTGAKCLRNQAELMMAPYLLDGFAFLGV